jgi:hypothetical protein
MSVAGDDVRLALGPLEPPVEPPVDPPVEPPLEPVVTPQCFLHPKADASHNAIRQSTAASVLPTLMNAPQPIQIRLKAASFSTYEFVNSA